MGVSGIELIAAERHRQIEEEKWSPEHDDAHKPGELSAAASAYSLLACNVLAGIDFDKESKHQLASSWPWDESWWKPSPDMVRNLVKAAALLAAEIDRLQRAEEKTNGIQ